MCMRLRSLSLALERRTFLERVIVSGLLARVRERYFLFGLFGSRVTDFLGVGVDCSLVRVSTSVYNFRNLFSNHFLILHF